MNRRHPAFKAISVTICLCFACASLGASPGALAQGVPFPPAGGFLALTPAYMPIHLKGLRIDPQNPFQFEFLVDPGDSGAAGDMLEQESTKLIKYFLASLTVPESDLWVNLSPHEAQRIIPKQFGLTEMGRDLLAQDYLLKQLTSSLMHPDESAGSRFWEKIHQKARAYGLKELPINTFNKVWIVPQEAVVFEGDGVAVVAESRLKVMLENDYLALGQQPSGENIYSDSENIIREVIIPVLEEEVNSGEHFAPLRQIYHSLILASWYKRKLKNSLLTKVYADQNKTLGVEHKEEGAIDGLYESYVESFKEGVYDFIKEEYDPVSQQIIPRKYFSGGMGFAGQIDRAMLVRSINTDGVRDRLLTFLSQGLLAVTVTLASPAAVLGQDTPPRPPARGIDLRAGYSQPDLAQINLYIQSLESGSVTFNFRVKGKDAARQLGFGDGFADFYDRLVRDSRLELAQKGGINIDRVIAIARVLAAGKPSAIEQKYDLQTFFQGVWSEYIVALANNRPDLNDVKARLLEDAGKTSKELRDMAAEALSFIAAPGAMTEARVNAFNPRWQEFNEKHLIPNGYYGELSVMMDTKANRSFYFSVIHKIERTERRRVDSSTVLTVYGRKIDRVNMVGHAGHSVTGKRIVFVDLDQVDVMVKKIADVLAGKPYILVESAQAHAPLVTQRLRQIFKGKTEAQIRQYMERVLRGHEYTHQAQEILNVPYKGTDRFGLAENLWSNQPAEFKDSVDHETLAMMGQLLTAQDPVTELAGMLTHLMDGRGTPYYIGARWIFNRLDGRGNPSAWTDFRDVDALVDQFERLARDRRLKEKVRQLISDYYSEPLLKTIESFDAAMLATVGLAGARLDLAAVSRDWVLAAGEEGQAIRGQELFSTVPSAGSADRDRAMLGEVSVDDVIDIEASITALASQAEDRRDGPRLAALQFLEAYLNDDADNTVSSAQRFLDAVDSPFEDPELQSFFDAAINDLAAAYGLTAEEAQYIKEKTVVVSRQQIELTSTEEAYLDLLRELRGGLMTINDSLRVGRIMRNSFGEEVDGISVGKDDIVRVLRKHQQVLNDRLISRMAEFILTGLSTVASFQSAKGDYGRYVIMIDREEVGEQLPLALLAESGHAVFEVLVALYRKPEKRRYEINAGVHEAADVLAQLMQRSFTSAGDQAREHGRIMFELLAQDLESIRRLVQDKYTYVSFGIMSEYLRYDKIRLLSEFPGIVEGVPNLSELIEQDSAYVSHMVGMYIAARLVRANNNDHTAVMKKLAGRVRSSQDDRWLSDPHLFVQKMEDAAMLGNITVGEVADLDAAISALASQAEDRRDGPRLAALQLIKAFADGDNGQRISMAQKYFDASGVEYEDFGMQIQFDATVEYLGTAFGLTEEETQEVKDKVVLVAGRPAALSEDDSALLYMLIISGRESFARADRREIVKVIREHFPEDRLSFPTRELVLKILAENAERLTPQFFFRVASSLVFDNSARAHFERDLGDYGRHIINIRSTGGADLSASLLAETAHAVLNIMAARYQARDGQRPEIDAAVDETFDFLSALMAVRFKLTSDRGKLLFEFLGGNDLEEMRRLVPLYYAGDISFEGPSYFAALDRLQLITEFPAIVESIPDLESAITDRNAVSHMLGIYMGSRIMAGSDYVPPVLKELAGLIRAETSGEWLADPHEFMRVVENRLAVVEAERIAAESGGADNAMLGDAARDAQPAVTENVGGIDLNPANWQLKSQSAGQADCLESRLDGCLNFDLPEEQIRMMQENINGFVPVIINIQPVINMPMFLGIGGRQPVDSVAYAN